MKRKQLVLGERKIHSSAGVPELYWAYNIPISMLPEGVIVAVGLFHEIAPCSMRATKFARLPSSSENYRDDGQEKCHRNTRTFASLLNIIMMVAFL